MFYFCSQAKKQSYFAIRKEKPEPPPPIAFNMAPVGGVVEPGERYNVVIYFSPAQGVSEVHSIPCRAVATDIHVPVPPDIHVPVPQQ